jgi:hypothetical protein
MQLSGKPIRDPAPGVPPSIGDLQWPPHRPASGGTNDGELT